MKSTDHAVKRTGGDKALPMKDLYPGWVQVGRLHLVAAGCPYRRRAPTRTGWWTRPCIRPWALGVRSPNAAVADLLRRSVCEPPHPLPGHGGHLGMPGEHRGVDSAAGGVRRSARSLPVGLFGSGEGSGSSHRQREVGWT